MNENEITVVVKGASKVAKLCDALHEAQAIAVRSANTPIKPSTTVTLLPGLVLTCSYITSFSISPSGPTQIDTYGRLVNAEILVKYVEAQ